MSIKVWINGTFDVLHLGHIKLIQRAKQVAGETCNVRIGVDTDERVKKLKGENRPVNTLEDRIEFLKSIKGVDQVVSFDSDEELRELIRDYKPDLMIIGDDYLNKPIIGQEFIELIHYMPRYEGMSTTKIVGD